VAAWIGSIDAAVVAHGDTPALESLARKLGRSGLGALAAAAALDCKGPEQILIATDSEAGSMIVGSAVEALSAGLLTAARDVVDAARVAVDSVTPSDAIGPMLAAHAVNFAEEDE
jgi:hypothetical protein